MKNMNKYLNKTFINSEGCAYKVISYNKGIYHIQFLDEYKYIKKCGVKEVKNGKIKNPFFKSIYGVGYYGIGSNTIPRNDIFYNCWHKMIERCYNEKSRKRYSTYEDCFVCEEWLSYYNFYNWCTKNYYELKNDNDKMCLDKDILVKGNKIYSPKTCVFVPNRINVLFTKNNKNRGLYPIGVYYKTKNNKFCSQCSVYRNNKKIPIYLGLFDNELDAFKTYKQFKEFYIKTVADEYKEKYENFPNKIYNALYSWKVEIGD